MTWMIAIVGGCVVVTLGWWSWAITRAVDRMIDEMDQTLDHIEGFVEGHSWLS